MRFSIIYYTVKADKQFLKWNKTTQKPKTIAQKESSEGKYFKALF